jgi:hypothetical protein
MRLVLVVLLMTVGCARDFATPAAVVPPVKLPQNAGCADAGACASGACQDGYCCDRVCAAYERCNLPGASGVCTSVPLQTPCYFSGQCDPANACQNGICCDRACQPYERCDLPGHEGHCTSVPLATPCQASSQCDPANACVDGICCERDCGPCATCSAGGRCTPAADHTDPHGDCGAGCMACFGGACAPAPRGTDPHGTCGRGFACGDGACLVTDGGACAADSDCLNGVCLAGRCLQPVPERVEVPGGNTLATGRVQLRVARAGSVEAVAYIEATYDLQSDAYTEQDIMVALRDGDGPWVGGDLVQHISNAYDPDFDPLALTFIGDQPLLILASYSNSCNDGHGSSCALQAQWLTRAGRLGATETIFPLPANMGHNAGVTAYVGESGQPRGGGHLQSGAFFFERFPDAGWDHQTVPLANASSLFGSSLGEVRGRRVLVATTTLDGVSFDSVWAVREDGAKLDLSRTFPCDLDTLGYVGVSPGRNAGPLALTAVCRFRANVQLPVNGPSWDGQLDVAADGGLAVSWAAHDTGKLSYVREPLGLPGATLDAFSTPVFGLDAEQLVIGWSTVDLIGLTLQGNRTVYLLSSYVGGDGLPIAGAVVGDGYNTDGFPNPASPPDIYVLSFRR